MMKAPQQLILAPLFSIYIMFAPAAHAHTLWLSASDYSPQPEPGSAHASTNVYFGWGHHYPVDDFFPEDNLDEFRLIKPDGKAVELIPNPGGFLATHIELEVPGLYWVSASTKPGFYTMFVDNGIIRHRAGPKTGLKEVIRSLRYEQYAKCLINAGQAEGDTFSRPIGHKLEIVPLDNPYKLPACGGRFLRIMVIFDGRPASYCQVFATYAAFSAGDDYAYTTTTDGEGIAKIRLLHWGMWLIKAKLRLPAPDELKDECNQLSYTATLTFEIP